MNRLHALAGLVALLSLGGASCLQAQALPFELRQISNRYPVTLYTGDHCAPCDSGRQLLMVRGIPFTERTVNTPAAGAVLQTLSGGSTLLPLLTIGQQRLQGFQGRTWQAYLDAAGYPATSQLPPGHRAPAATPLAPAGGAPTHPAATQADPRVAPPLAPVSPAATPPATGPTTDNPAGIQF